MLHEKVYAWEVVLSDSGQRSYDEVTIKSGASYAAGTVLGKIDTAGADFGKYAIADNHTPATNGTEDAIAVLMHDVDASDADQKAVVMRRDGQVKGDLLVYKASTTSGEKAAIHDALEAFGIVVRPRIATPSPPPPPPPPPPGP